MLFNNESLLGGLSFGAALLDHTGGLLFGHMAVSKDLVG